MLRSRRLTKLKTFWILIVVVLVVGILTIAYFSYPKPLKNETPKPADNEVNVCLHLSEYDNQTISYLSDLRVKWVRTDWLTSNNEMSVYSQSLQDNGINLLAIVNASIFPFQNSMLEEWNRTVTEIATSEGFKSTDAIEICNEPNGNNSFIPPETYYEMLKSAYAIIKNYTTIPVVFAGISPNSEVHNYNWTSYLNAVFAYNDTNEYFDYMGIHLYDDTVINLSTLQFVKNLTDKPIWLTETGKPSENNDETAQATYLSTVYSTFKPLVSKIFIYELKDKGLSSYGEDHFGLLTYNGTRKESYHTVWDISHK